MKPVSWAGAVTLLLIGSVALADVGEPAQVQQLRDQVDALQRTIAELKRENETLRTQWGQATMEINRLRAQIAAMGPQVVEEVAQAAEPQAAAPQPPQPLEVTPEATPEVTPAVAPEVAPEVARLREQIEDLRSRNEELTQLAGLGPQDERVASQAARIEARFDEATGRTVVRTQQDRLRVTAGSKADHFLSLAYSYQGETMATPPQEVTMFIQAVYSGGLYGKDKPLVLTIDGEAVTVPVAAYDGNRRSTTLAGRRRVNRHDETVTFVVDRPLLRRLARAVSVTGRMGVASFELSRDQIALFTAVKKRIEAGM